MAGEGRVAVRTGPGRSSPRRGHARQRPERRELSAAREDARARARWWRQAPAPSDRAPGRKVRRIQRRSPRASRRIDRTPSHRDAGARRRDRCVAGAPRARNVERPVQQRRRRDARRLHVRALSGADRAHRRYRRRAAVRPHHHGDRRRRAASGHERVRLRSGHDDLLRSHRRQDRIAIRDVGAGRSDGRPLQR